MFGGEEGLVEILMNWGTMYGIKVVGALLILVVGLPVARILTRVAGRLMRKAKVEETLVLFGAQVLNFVMVVFLIIATLNQVGVQTTSLIAVLGATALAVGLALQSNLSSLAAGVLILLFRPFKVGDVIEASGVLGTVEAITMLVTRIIAPDGKTIIVPNTNVLGSAIINYTAKPFRRIDLVFGIGYNDDLLKAKAVLMEVLQSDQRVLTDPAPQVTVLELADSSVNFAVRPWVAGDDFWSTRCDLIEKVKLRFDQEGISIPFPQQDVHLFQDKAEATVQ